MDDLSHTKCFFKFLYMSKSLSSCCPNLVRETTLLSKYSYYPPYYYSHFSHKKKIKAKGVSDHTAMSDAAKILTHTV